MDIRLNGKRYECAYSSASDIRKNLFSEEDIIIINGFQISDDCTLKDNDEVFVISRGVMPAREQLEEMMAARHTPSVHNAVKKGFVGIAGLGGLGSNIAVSLARTGVGRMLLADFDIVEPSNLNRQSYYISHLGMYKTDALKNQLQQINPFIKIETCNIRVTDSNACELFGKCDVVCEAFDSPQAKAMLVNVLLQNCPEVKIVSGSGMAGLSSSNLIRTTRKVKNLYVCGDQQSEAKQGNGLMAPRVQICAGHQSNMVLRLLTGTEDV